jgi:hypothetical protein
MGKIGGYGDLLARGVGNDFHSKIYGGHWIFFNIKIINQSIEAIKKRMPDCSVKLMLSDFLVTGSYVTGLAFSHFSIIIVLFC